MATVERARPEVIVDLAARAGVRPSIADPDAYVDINVRGFQHTLAASPGGWCPSCLRVLEFGLRGRPAPPVCEEQMEGRPLSPYGATKVAGEALAYAHHAITGLPVAIARLFTVTGRASAPTWQSTLSHAGC